MSRQGSRTDWRRLSFGDCDCGRTPRYEDCRPGLFVSPQGWRALSRIGCPLNGPVCVRPSLARCGWAVCNHEPVMPGSRSGQGRIYLGTLRLASYGGDSAFNLQLVRRVDDGRKREAAEVSAAHADATASVFPHQDVDVQWCITSPRRSIISAGTCGRPVSSRSLARDTCSPVGPLVPSEGRPLRAFLIDREPTLMNGSGSNCSAFAGARDCPFGLIGF